MTVHLNKARGKWTYDFWRKGTRYQGYLAEHNKGAEPRNKTEAKKIEARLKTTVEDKAAAPIVPTEITVAQGFALFLKTVEGKPNYDNQLDYAAELIEYFGPATPVSHIQGVRVAEYVTASLKKPVRIWIGGGRKKDAARKPGRSLWKPGTRLRQPGTINRYLASLRAMLYLLTELRDDATQEPLLRFVPKFQDLDEAKPLPRPIPDEVLAICIPQSPPHVAAGVVLCIHMGFREQEAVGLKRDQFDRQLRGVWLHALETKGKRAAFVPANDIAFAVLDRLDREAEVAGSEYLLLYRQTPTAKPRPVTGIARAFNRVLRANGFKQYNFHNTKAAFVTPIAQVVEAPTLQNLARHKNITTTQRYYEIVDPTKRAAVDTLTERRATAGIDVTAAFGTINVPRRGQKMVRKVEIPDQPESLTSFPDGKPAEDKKAG